MNFVVSTAHEVVESLPVWSGMFECVRCQKHGPLSEMFSDEPSHRCTPHLEKESSGWRHDERFSRPDQ